MGRDHKNHIGSPCRSVVDLLSFKQSLSLIIQHLIASTQRSMELTASICKYVESTLKEDTVGILEGHHNLPKSSLKVSVRDKRVEIY